jgi:hypothetical protein
LGREEILAGGGKLLAFFIFIIDSNSVRETLLA